MAVKQKELKLSVAQKIFMGEYRKPKYGYVKDTYEVLYFRKPAEGIKSGLFHGRQIVRLKAKTDKEFKAKVKQTIRKRDKAAWIVEMVRPVHRKKLYQVY